MINEKQETVTNEVIGVVFVGCLLLGFAVGFLTWNVVAGLFGGLGFGFMAMSIVMAVGKRKGSSGVIFLGCLLLGFGVGFWVWNVAAGLFVGLGVGFIAMGILRFATGQW